MTDDRRLPLVSADIATLRRIADTFGHREHREVLNAAFDELERLRTLGEQAEKEK